MSNAIPFYAFFFFLEYGLEIMSPLQIIYIELRNSFSKIFTFCATHPYLRDVINIPSPFLPPSPERGNQSSMNNSVPSSEENQFIELDLAEVEYPF